MNREKEVVKTSIISIITNILLALAKAIIGIISSSIAIVTDAINNLSDGLSSLITIVGTKFASKKPDKKHPYGYGRIEYITSMIISFIVLYAGITVLIESIKKIIKSKVKEIEFIEEYHGEKIPKNKKSITFRVKLGNDNATMTNEEITTKMNSLIKALNHQCGAELREK